MIRETRGYAFGKLVGESFESVRKLPRAGDLIQDLTAILLGIIEHVEDPERLLDGLTEHIGNQHVSEEVRGMMYRVLDDVAILINQPDPGKVETN